MGAAVVISAWALMILAGWATGRHKGHPVLGAVLGAVLGLIGVVIVACLSRTREAQVREAARRQSVEAEAEARRQAVLAEAEARRHLAS